MKKILFSLLMLFGMTTAWAGAGTGSKGDPYTGEWQASKLIPELKEGKHLAYDCIINTGSTDIGITVFDDKIGNVKIIGTSGGWESWGVGYAISPDKPLPNDYQDYYSLNSSEVRKTQTFIVTKAEYNDATHIYITGHYSGHYDRGDGTKENPYWGEWTIYELYDKLEDGVHLALDCDIKCDGDYISVKDTRLNQEVASMWSAWSPGNFIGDTNPGGPYTQYGKDNPLDNRKGQTFVVTDKDTSFGNTATFHIIGHFTGFYTTTDADGFVYVESAEQMKIILGGNDNVKANTRAKIKLTDDIYLTDIAVGTFCDTFYGTLDGDGHTIHGSHDGTRQNKTYLFTNSDGATFKNLNFYNIRIDNRNNHNQAVIASQAKNECVFENITFDNISTYVGDSHDNTGAVVGYATTNCTFKNITVKNSDFTADNCQSGAVVGHAMNCTFENIKVEHCESTARNSYSGGVAGRADDCTISNVEILGTFIKTEEKYGGGVVGRSENTQFTNCVVDDQSCVLVDGEGTTAFAGGITGIGVETTISNCINSALIAADASNAGGIVGRLWGGTSNILGCLNAGMVITIKMDEVINSFYNKYKTKSGMTCVTKTYQGKDYVIRRYEASTRSWGHFGGIAGSINEGGNVSKCVNFGSVYSEMDNQGYGNGGIVGLVKDGTISDCLSDFSSAKGIFGICQFEGNGVSVNNCLNMTTYKDISAYKYAWGDFKGEHNYSLTTAEDAHHTTKTTVATIKSGEICHLLGANWEQNLGTDAYPTPTGSQKGIYHTRKVSTQYGTVCVPYPMQSDDNVRFYMLEEVKKGGDAVTLVFTYVERLEAGFPAIFSVAEQGDYTFEPIDDERRFLPPFAAAPSHGSEFILQGTFEKVVFEGEVAKERYYISGDKIRNAAKVTIEPFRCYILGPNVTTLQNQAKAIRFVLDDENGETTALEYVANDLVPMQGNGKTYSLMGTEVGKGYRGIVIQNGKKYVRN